MQIKTDVSTGKKNADHAKMSYSDFIINFTVHA